MDPAANEFSSVLIELRSALRSSQDLELEAPAAVLELLAVLPALPEQVAAAGLPLDSSGRIYGPEALDLLESLADRDLVEIAGASLPWTGKLFRMSARQRRSAMRWVESRPNLSQRRQWSDPVAEAWALLQRARPSFEIPYPPVMERWCSLVNGPDTQELQIRIADRLEAAVDGALAAARELKLQTSSEAMTLLDASEPLATTLGGAVRVAYERSQRALELHYRRSSDSIALRNYLSREELDSALKRLVSQDEFWALHYLGAGGAGKTMFLRYVDAVLASDLKLATARVDFDHLNPNYPLRSPGLLLLGFAEDLRLSAPESAVESFRKLSRLVNDVHQNLDEAQRSGQQVALGFDAPGFDFVVDAFVWALEQVFAAGRRPVLILDTCEELMRLSSENRLPRTVVETFRLLEELHRRFPPVRIVFSGRRLLAQGGVGWKCAQEELPRREYLMLCPIPGFTVDEAARMLRDYGTRADPPRPVPSRFQGRILELSSEAQDKEMAGIQSVPDGHGIPLPIVSAGTEPRHNPYDLALYAGWAASGDSDFASDTQSGSKRHYFVRERIVGRLREDLARWLPALTILERFDEELIAEITEAGDSFPRLWAEIRRQEWIDIDRGSASVREQVPLFFWNLDRRMRERLEAYYVEEVRDAWVEAQHRVADALEAFTLERAWGALTPTYFAVCVRLLGNEPRRAAVWWTKVEQRILIDDAWDWADKITGILLGPESPPLGTREAPHVLQGPISALRANVILHQAPDEERLQEAWQTVMDAADSYPSVEGAHLLRFRGLAGWIGSWRYASTTPGWKEIHRLGELLEQLTHATVVSPIQMADQTLRSQEVYTQRALIENLAEIFEASRTIGWFPAPALHSLMDNMAPAAKGEPYGLVCQARVDSMEGKTVDRSAWEAKPHQDDVRAFDWIPPANLRARQLLEWGRIFEREGIDHEQTGQFCRLAVEQAGPSLKDLDCDRLLSQALRLGGTALVSSDAVIRLIPSSLAIGDLREECQAHQSVPPFYATAIQALAGDGLVDLALNALEDARAQKPSKAVLRWLNGVSSNLNRRFRLAPREASEFEAPELPANKRTDVAMFLTLAEAALAKVKDGDLSEGEAIRMRDAAARLCSRLAIQLPVTASALPSVPAGWQPWFARFLLVLDRKREKPDAGERESIRAALAALYPSGRAPDDIEFALTAVKARVWPYVVLGMTVIGLLAWLTVWLAGEGITTVTGRHLPWWQSATVLVCLGIAATALSRLLRLFSRTFGAFLGMEYTIHPRLGEGNAIDVEYAMRLFTYGVFNRNLRSVNALTISEPYESASKRVSRREPLAGSLGYLYGMGRYRTTITVLSGHEAVAGPCWEALIGMAGGSLPKFQNSYIFRRTAPASQRLVEPFYGKMSVITVSAIRSLRFFASGANWNTRYREDLPDYPDESVGILVLQAEVGVAHEAVRFAMGDKRSTYLTPNDLSRLFPNLRLCILMDLDRSEVTERTPLDRISAARARKAAHELFLCGIPAVITIPYLPVRTNLSDETLAILAKAAARNTANSRNRLQIAVRDVQNLIYKKSGLPRTDSAELAYDACYYAADIVNLQVDVPRKSATRLTNRMKRARSA